MIASRFVCVIVLVEVSAAILLSFLPSSKGSINQLVSSSASHEVAHFFGYGSGISDLSDSTLVPFLRESHKPKFVLFYAPWCGHCQRFKEEYVRLVREVAGIARLGAVNMDVYKSLGSEYNIQGFPTILFWGTGNRITQKYTVYNGERTASSLRAFLVSHLSNSPSRVENVQTADALLDRVRLSPYSVAGVFFSSRAHPAAMMSVMSLSPKLSDMPFIFVDKEHSEEVGKAFNITKIPNVSVISIEKDSGKLSVDTYLHPRIVYDSIARFFFYQLESKKSGGLSNAGGNANQNLDAEGHVKLEE